MLFRRGDVDDLHSRLEHALASPDPLRELGAMGRRRATEHFSWASVTDAHECVFRGGKSPYVDAVPTELDVSIESSGSRRFQRSTARNLNVP